MSNYLAHEPVTTGSGLVGIQFTGPKPADDQHILVTLRQIGEPDYSVLYDKDGLHEGIDASDYIQGATALDPKVIEKERIGLMTILAATFAVAMVIFSVAGAFKFVAARVVLTGSMVPAINPGDLILTINDKYREPVLGDVVVYIGRKFDGTVVAPFSHRIVGGNAINGWEVKGDANEAPDIQHPTADDIEGVVVATIPNVGKVLSPQFLVMLGIVGLAAWLILDWSRSD